MAFLEGYRKFIFGLLLTLAGLSFGYMGDWENAWKLLPIGIGIGVGGNMVDKAIRR